MELIIEKKGHESKDKVPETPEGRLELVEVLRRQAGLFVYEKSEQRLRRVVEIIRKK